jgi:hypothetical protein
MTAIEFLESLETRGIKLCLTEDEVRAVAPLGGLIDSDREWIKRFKDDLTRVIKVRTSRPPSRPMPPSPETWRRRVASWGNGWRARWSQLILDHQLARFDQEEAEWRSFLALVDAAEWDRLVRTNHRSEASLPCAPTRLV